MSPIVYANIAATITARRVCRVHAASRQNVVTIIAGNRLLAYEKFAPCVATTVQSAHRRSLVLHATLRAIKATLANDANHLPVPRRRLL